MQLYYVATVQAWKCSFFLLVAQDQNTTLVERLQQTEGDLSSQLRQTREALANRSQELDSLKSQWDVNSSDRDVKHRQELTSEKEKALQVRPYGCEKKQEFFLLSIW